MATNNVTKAAGTTDRATSGETTMNQISRECAPGASWI